MSCLPLVFIKEALWKCTTPGVKLLNFKSSTVTESVSPLTFVLTIVQPVLFFVSAIIKRHRKSLFWHFGVTLWRMWILLLDFSIGVLGFVLTVATVNWLDSIGQALFWIKLWVSTLSIVNTRSLDSRKIVVVSQKKSASVRTLYNEPH